MSEHGEYHPSQSDAKKVDQPFTLRFSEHDLRHVRVILKRWAIEQKDWAQVRCAVGIYERINEQLDENEKDLLAGPPAPARERKPKPGFIRAGVSTNSIAGGSVGNQTISTAGAEFIHKHPEAAKP